MNLITFGFSEKGTPVFLNQEPYPQVGTMYLMKAGKNSVIGITLDDSVVKLAKAPRRARGGRRAKTEATAATKKRGRKAVKLPAKKEKVEKRVGKSV